MPHAHCLSSAQWGWLGIRSIAPSQRAMGLMSPEDILRAANSAASPYRFAIGDLTLLRPRFYEATVYICTR